MAAPFQFAIERSVPELIVPAKPTPYEIKCLSDIDDQKGLRDQTPNIQFYQHSMLMEEADPVKIIKAAIAEALVYYYPFAGRIRGKPNEKLVVECNGEGVLFTEATADARLEDFGDVLLPPFPCIKDLLYDVPNSGGISDCPLFLIQVTRLKCGGFVFANRTNHTMCDAYGLVQFLNTIAELARGASSPSVPPLWLRELLIARDPPQISYKHHAYDKLQYDSTNGTSVETIKSVHRSVFLTNSNIRNLKKHLLPPHLQKCSTFDILTAVVWRCRTIALNLNSNSEVRLAWYASARAKFNPPLPPGFYGNALGFPVAISKVDILCNSPLSYAVELIAQTKAEMTGEFMRSSIDFLAKGGRRGFEESRTFWVSDLRQIGFNNIDFGWGKPKFAGPIGAYFSFGFYLPGKNSENEEGVAVVMNLPEHAMESFVAEIGNMIKSPRNSHTISSFMLSNM